ncbi:uncharacterized protein LOC129728902 [Wyeomyia smithii]|uniref:uncharacterized protein LOC129728902 n=2 Tax=Wyeomyia smithii TaxID=174621 RepID=UPI002467BAAA|nr:uncharacterized protein LOC129728902 [Wyeomyia smithii]
MNLPPGPCKENATAKRAYRFSEVAGKHVLTTDAGWSCNIEPDVECSYMQRTKLDLQNFIRHFRSLHTERAKALGLLLEQEPSAKKPRVVPKRPIPIDQQMLVEAATKLVALHNLPVSCVEWEGMNVLLDPIKAALGVTLDTRALKCYLAKAAELVRQEIATEMKEKLVSLKIDSASRHNRHVLAILAQYDLNGEVVIRTLGIIEVKVRQTAAFLKTKILQVIQEYNLTLTHVWSVTCDNGANMLAAVKQLQLELEKQHQSNLYADDDDNSDYTDQDAEHDMAEHQLTAALGEELRESLNLIRCAVHTLQLAILDVVSKSHEAVKLLTESAKKCRSVKYTSAFELQKARYPPVWGQTRWCGIYSMVSCFLDQKSFFEKLAEQFPEMDLSGSWDFTRQYAEAFKPLFICTKNMQSKHISLSEFYLQWMITIQKVKKMETNPFSAPLVESLNKRLTSLRTSRAFKIALYLDPRLNFAGSKLFTSEEKEEIQSYIVETWNRIHQLQSPVAKPSDVQQLINQDKGEDENDVLLTELFGGTAESSFLEDNNFNQQLKAIEVEPRRTYNFDVWNIWVDRKCTHPELSAVAAVVLATPSNQVSVERAFSALALVLTNNRSTLGEDTLSNILIIKLNKPLFDKIIPKLCDAAKEQILELK